MTHIHKSKILPVTIAAGAAGALARFFLYRFGPDDKGLLPRFHPLQLICLALAVVLAVFLHLVLRKRPDGKSGSGTRFTPLGIPGLLAGFGLLLYCGIQLLRSAAPNGDSVQILLPFLSAFCILGLLISALLRKRVHYLLYFILCASFALDILIRYRSWSGNPQLPDYCFQLAACVFLTLTAYYRTAAETGIGSEKKRLFCSCLALFFCMLSIVGPDSREYFLGCGCWLWAELQARPKKAKPISPTTE